MQDTQAAQPMAGQTATGSEAKLEPRRSNEEQMIIDDIRRLEEHLAMMHKRLRVEEGITRIKEEADRMRYSI